jgi:hypothetical protein
MRAHLVPVGPTLRSTGELRVPLVIGMSKPYATRTEKSVVTSNTSKSRRVNLEKPAAQGRRDLSTQLTRARRPLPQYSRFQWVTLPVVSAFTFHTAPAV